MICEDLLNIILGNLQNESMQAIQSMTILNTICWRAVSSAAI